MLIFEIFEYNLLIICFWDVCYITNMKIASQFWKYAK